MLNRKWSVTLAHLPFFTAAALAAELDLTWHTMDTGAASHLTGGPFAVSGTIGQPDAGRLSGGPFEITGGFWLELAPRDCNEDGGVELQDFTNFADCMVGPGLDPGSSRCVCLDMEGDGDVDLADMADMQTAIHE